MRFVLDAPKQAPVVSQVGRAPSSTNREVGSPKYRHAPNGTRMGAFQQRRKTSLQKPEGSNQSLGSYSRALDYPLQLYDLDFFRTVLPIVFPTNDDIAFFYRMFLFRKV